LNPGNYCSASASELSSKRACTLVPTLTGENQVSNEIATLDKIRKAEVELPAKRATPGSADLFLGPTMVPLHLNIATGLQPVGLNPTGGKRLICNPTLV
jgi:hypothetical protein